MGVVDGQVGDAESAAGGIFVAGEVLVQARGEVGHGGGAGGVDVAVVFLVRILPVWNDARAGEHTGHGVNAFPMRAPLRAKWSRVGVTSSRLP